MPIISGGGGGGGAASIAAVLAVGDDAAGAGIDNLGETTLEGDAVLLSGAVLRGDGTKGGRVEPEARGGTTRGGDVLIVGGDGGVAARGGNTTMTGGSGNDFMANPSVVRAQGGDAGGHGRLMLTSADSGGVAGETVLSDGLGNAVWGGVVAAAGVPAGAPSGKLPIAIDTTAVTGGLYLWTGAAWVKGSVIP